MLRLEQPKKFSFRAEEWPEWITEFKRFRTAGKLHREEGEVQRDTLLYCMGTESEKVLRALTFGDNESDTDFDCLVKKFEDYFIPQRNIIFERAKFQDRRQIEGETVEEFYRSLKDLGKYCKYNDEDEIIRDRFVVGLTDQKLKEKLQLVHDLTLTKALETARQHELIKKQMEQQQVEVDMIYKGKGKSTTKSTMKPVPVRDRSTKSCSRCGRQHDRGQCFAFGKTCMKCGGRNHFAKVCRTKMPQHANASNARPHNNSKYRTTHIHKKQINEVTDEPREQYFIDNVGSSSSEPWRVDIDVNKSRATFKIDTGADVNIINEETWKALGRPNLQSNQIILTSAGGNLNIKGQFDAQIGGNLKTRFFVVNNRVDNLLSRDTSAALGLVKRVDGIKLSVVKCEPVKIKLKEGIKPYSLSVARRVPIPLQEKVKKELQRMKEMDIIEEITEPTDWVSPMVPVPKANGEVRICVDLKKLNKAVQREKFVIPMFDDIIHQLSGSTVFSKLDAQSGFWQLPLDQETAKLTTFITPHGRYFMKRVPFGISSAPEIFMRVVSKILEGIPGVICYFDDILCHSKTKEEHGGLLTKVHVRLKEAGLQLNKEKCEYWRSEITFLGHVIDAEGCRPDPTKVEAIKNMTEVRDVVELRRYLGMVNYLGRYLPHLSTVLKPLNQLLEKETAWTWGPPQSEAFRKVQELITSAPVLAYFDPSRPTVVEADSSSYGLGGCLLQEFDNGLRPVAFCSRTLTSAEQRYAQIEKECLASVWACERFDRYLMGLENFTLYSDHKPLIPLINSRDLSETPVRCQRMLIRLMRYNPTAEYRPGPTMVTSDTLSRSPSFGIEKRENLGKEVQFHVDMVTSSWPVSDNKLRQIREKTLEDVCLSSTLDYVRHGWPEYREDIKISALSMFPFRHELSEVDGILVKGDRIVVPYKMRKEILERIHEGHFGITKCKERGKQSVWWPEINKQIKDMVAKCQHCLEKRPTQRKEPLLPSALPDRPFQKVGVDICEVKKNQYLVLEDYYSRYLEIMYLSNTSSRTVIFKLKSCFARYGIPECLVSDNARQFTSTDFRQFATQWNFKHVTSSPRFPQCNGKAERAVRTAKEIMKQEDIFLALLAYRTTPLVELGVSPAQLMFDRQIRSTMPCLPQKLKHNCVPRETLEFRDRRAKQKQKENFDRHYGVRNLPKLTPGDPVLVKTDDEKMWKTPARVVEEVAPRSYVVRTEFHGNLRRNRRHLQKIPDENFRRSCLNLDMEQEPETLPETDPMSTIATRPWPAEAERSFSSSRPTDQPFSSPRPTDQPRSSPRPAEQQRSSPRSTERQKQPSTPVQSLSRPSQSATQMAQQIALRRSSRQVKPPRRLISE